MMVFIQRMWTERSGREQRLLGIMFALLVPVVLWFVIISPLVNALESAQTRLDKAALDQGIVAARTAALRDALRGKAAPLDAGVVSVVGAMGQAAGLTLNRIDPQGDDRATIAIGSIKVAALFGWLQALALKDVSVERITVRSNADTTLSVDAVLRARR